MDCKEKQMSYIIMLTEITVQNYRQDVNIGNNNEYVKQYN